MYQEAGGPFSSPLLCVPERTNVFDIAIDFCDSNQKVSGEVGVTSWTSSLPPALGRGGAKASRMEGCCSRREEERWSPQTSRKKEHRFQ